MPDQVTAQGVTGTSGAVFAVDLITSQNFPFSKLVYGATGVSNIVSTTLPFPVVSASQGLVQISGTPTVLSASSGLVQISGIPSVVVTTSAGYAAQANIPMVSASSGLVQISGTVISASSGLVQISGIPSVVVATSAGLTQTVTILSASSGLIQISGIPSVVVATSAGLTQTVTVLSASSGLVQISGTPTVAMTSSNPLQEATVMGVTSSGYSVTYTITTGNTPTASLKTSEGHLLGYSVFNSTSAIRSVKFYNTSSAPTAGTTANQLVSVLIPGSTGGGGANMTFPIPGLYFSNGIGYAITANVGATDTGPPGASDVIFNAYYT